MTQQDPQAYELHALLSSVDDRERFEDDLADWLDIHVAVTGGYSFSLRPVEDDLELPVSLRPQPGTGTTQTQGFGHVAMTEEPPRVNSRNKPIDEGLINRVADAFHSRECTVYDGRQAVDSCRGRDRDRAIAERAVWDVTAALRPGEALFPEGLRHQRIKPPTTQPEDPT